MARKKRKYTPKERAKMFKPTYFFGYGSLMAPGGINYRGMKYRYIKADLAPAKLQGYFRSMCAYFQFRNFYGLLEDTEADCNGVVFEVKDWYDYRALLNSEGATSAFRHLRTYWPIDVTDKIEGWAPPKDYRVVTLLCKKDKSGSGIIESAYIKHCWKAALLWGDDFAQKFLETGGVEYNPDVLRKQAITGKLRVL